MVMYKIIKILAAITVAISTHQSITESCEAHKFVKTEGMELPNQVIRTIVKSFVQLCWGECAWWPKCISVNARKVDEIFFECDLNDSNTTTKALVPREGSDYYEMTEPEEQICKLYSCKKKHIASVWAWGAWSDTCKLPRTRKRKCINPVTQADENDCSGSSDEEVKKSSACSNLASLGVRQGGSIPDGNFNSSSAQFGGQAWRGRLDGNGWVGQRIAGQWLEVDLGSVKTITSFLSQGRKGYNQWVTEFYLEYRSDSIEPWTMYDGGLPSCGGKYAEIKHDVTSRDTIVTTHLPTPIKARYVRMVVIEYRDSPAIRMDLFGC